MKAFSIALLFCLPVAALAADNPDESFFKKAAEAGMAEVEAGKLAQEKGTSQAVKDFGAMMVKDHSEANAKLTKIAVAKDVELPKGPGMMSMAREKKTEMKSGESFDKDYIRGQIKAHKDTVELLQKESTQVRIPRRRRSRKRRYPRSRRIWRRSIRLQPQRALNKRRAAPLAARP